METLNTTAIAHTPLPVQGAQRDHPTLAEPVDRGHILHRHLRENEADLVRQNIVVRVDSINAAKNVAMCSVQQGLFGIFRRKRSDSELAWRAGQALAPFAAFGLTTLIDVQHARTRPFTPTGNLFGRTFSALWHWLGYPLARTGYKQRIILRDPFGWRDQ